MTTDKLLYGADIKLNSRDDIDLNFKDDFVIIEGKDNINQAIKNRLRVELGEFGLHPNYGSRLTSILGKPNTSLLLSEIRMEVRKVLLQEPRVESILSITTKYDDDDKQKILVGIKYYPIQSTEPLNIIYPIFLTA